MKCILPLLTLLSAGCAEKELPCKEGYGRASDGICYPIDLYGGLIESVSIGPPTIGTNETITSVVVMSGETVDTGLEWEDYPVRYQWFIDGEESLSSANHLHSRHFAKGQSVSLIVSPLDGEGASVPSNTITIQNTPPPTPTVQILPESPYAKIDSLLCDIDGVEDPDSDDITYTIQWTRDGREWTAMPPPPPDDGSGVPPVDTGEIPPTPPPEPDEVPASLTSGGQEWACNVWAYDGEEWSQKGSASTRINAEFAGWDEQNFYLSEADYILHGENDNDVAGASLSMVGDVDGDGLGDFLVPAFFNDEGADDGGKVYLVRASDIEDGPGEYDLVDMPYSFVGQTNTEEAGHAVGPAGDVDGDGLDDFMICGYRNDDPYTDNGRVYVFFASGLVEPGVRSTATADMTFVGEAADNRLGHAISGAGDMDGDGLPELIMGSYGYTEMGVDSGKTYIIPSSTMTPGMETTLGESQYMYLGEGPMEASGHAVRTAWDVDGDGLNDVVVGARRNSTGALEGGKGYLIYGDSLGAIGEVKSLADADHGFYGEVVGGWVGYQAAGAGDVDGDGRADLLFGAHTSDDAGGRSYLILADSIGPALQSMDYADAVFTGEYPSNHSGRSLAPAGDVDGDGLADLLIGARNAGDRVGRAYLYYGKSVTTGINPLGDADVRFIGEDAFDEAGYTVSSAGDVNGDGLSDLLISAWQGDFDGTTDGPGKAYLILAPSE